MAGWLRPVWLGPGLLGRGAVLHLTGALLAGALLGTGAAPAEALAASCSALRAELASARKGTSDRAKAERYASALRRQKKELHTTRGMAERAGCANRRNAQCSRLTSTVTEMEANVRSLERQRRRALGGGSGRTRTSIRRDIQRKGCDAKPKQQRTAKAGPGKRMIREGRTSISRPLAPAQSGPSMTGSHRTVCVRTCDGYYFPISNAVGRGAFGIDTKRCSRMCPRAETRLFVHGAGGGAETMRDRTGRRYADMTYAFRHTREDYRPSEACTCGRPLAPVRPAPLRGSVGSEAGVGRTVPTPLGMAPPSGDAETRRNAALGFGWDRARAMVARGIEPEKPRRIRVVGPAFLPDREAVADR